MTSDSMTIGDDSVVSFHYTLRDDAGTITESSEGSSPVVYMHGRNNIVPGLETQLRARRAARSSRPSWRPSRAMGCATRTPCSACR